MNFSRGGGLQLLYSKIIPCEFLKGWGVAVVMELS